MNLMSMLILAFVICVTLPGGRTLTRDEIFRIASAGIPGVGSRYQNTGYRPHSPGITSNRGYLPSPYRRPAPRTYRPYPSNGYKYLPQFPAYAPQRQPYVQPQQTYSVQQQGRDVQPQTPVGTSFNQKPATASQSCNIDPSAIYRLSSDGTNYPTEAIMAELVKQPTIQQALMTMKIDRPYQSSNGGGLDLNTCKTTLTTLASFYSSQYGKQCWVLRDYQERVEIANCRHGSCNSCSQVILPGLKSMCTTSFRHVSVWAYCENVFQGSAIIHTRLVVPAFCSCKHRAPC